MQLESKHIYKLVADKKGIPVELVKSIGDVIFKELSDLQRDAPNLILNIRSLGRRYVRKSKVDNYLGRVPFIKQDILDGKRKYLPMEQVLADEAICLRFRELYEKYLKEKKEAKTLRNAYPSPDQSLPK